MVEHKLGEFSPARTFKGHAARRRRKDREAGVIRINRKRREPDIFAHPAKARLVIA
jgi:hypothetical protein